MGKSWAPFRKYLPRQMAHSWDPREKKFAVVFQFGAEKTGFRLHGDGNEGVLHAFMQMACNVA